jgi:multiple sugar transport system ATP-binding protein
MAALTLTGITKSFGATHVLAPLDLDIGDGEFVTLVGPSGCGKSTLLRIVAGLERQDSGSVAIGGRPVDHLRPHERKVAMVFQSYALYPHMSVFDNIALPLTMARLNVVERVPLVRLFSPRRRAAMRQIAAEVRTVAEQLQIESLFARRPAQLSGGQRQRVALGRAMVRHPDVFLMDEPLSNLDAKLRVHMRSELAELHARLGVTMVYVTHDQVEAMTMADRLAVMDQGRILQLGTPAEVYARPASVTVAQFIGSPGINLLPGKVADDGTVELLDARLPLAVDAAPGARLTLGVRPEALRLQPQPGDARIGVRLHRRENLGSESILHLDVLGTDLKLLAKVAHDERGLESLPDGPMQAGIAPASCHVFDAAGQRLAVESGPTMLRNADAHPEARNLAVGHS